MVYFFIQQPLPVFSIFQKPTKVVVQPVMQYAHQRSAPGRECPPGPASPEPGRDWIPGLSSMYPGAGREPGGSRVGSRTGAGREPGGSRAGAGREPGGSRAGAGHIFTPPGRDCRDLKFCWPGVGREPGQHGHSAGTWKIPDIPAVQYI